jgi:DnaJ-class molecular chaperone
MKCSSCDGNIIIDEISQMWCRHCDGTGLEPAEGSIFDYLGNLVERADAS